MTEASDRGAGFWPVMFVVAALLGVLLYFAGNAPPLGSSDKERERAAISLCWEDQGRKSLEPDAARFVARACEMMEADFLKKHGRRP
jgi:hypothetical protein